MVPAFDEARSAWQPMLVSAGAFRLTGCFESIGFGENRGLRPTDLDYQLHAGITDDMLRDIRTVT